MNYTPRHAAPLKDETLSPILEEFTQDVDDILSQYADNTANIESFLFDVKAILGDVINPEILRDLQWAIEYNQQSMALRRPVLDVTL